jgi:cold shock CspA family protein
MPTGRIKFYYDIGGYGFIRHDNPGENDVWFHVTQWIAESIPQKCDRVQFDIDTQLTGKHKGKTAAFRVKPIKQQQEAAE